MGNSSSGIKETLFFNCKTINLGSRQKSRFKSSNVYECKIDYRKILDLFKKKKEEKPYAIKGDNGLPLWVIPLPSGINMDTEDEPKDFITKGEDE